MTPNLNLYNFYGMPLSGPSATAPTNVPNGHWYFATDLGVWLVFNGTSYQASSVPQSGATGSRPAAQPIGTPYFDTTIGQVVVWNGTAWQLDGGAVPGNGSANGIGSRKTARFTCDVTGGQYSGAVGTFDTGIQIPANAIILSGMLDIPAAFTSGGSATLAVQAATAGDLLAATAVASLTVGRHDVIPNGTAADTIKMATAQDIKVVIAVAAMTAGTLVGFVDYVVSQ